MTVSRRTFLKTTAAATLAASGAMGASANERVTAAIIGCRNRGHQIANRFLDSGQFDVASLCDCDTAMIDVAMGELGDRAGRKPRHEEDFRRVLEDRAIDAVAICTPDHWHAHMAVMALDAGKHVYVEKPLSYTVEEGQGMVAAAAGHPSLTAVVGTQQRSGAHFHEAKAFIDGGGIGKVAFCRAWITHARERLQRVPDTAPPASLDYELWVGPAPIHPYNANRHHYNWHWVRDWGTGEMGNWGAHWLDVARWFLGLGSPEAVTGHGGTFVDRDIKEWPDTQTVLYEYPELTLVWEQRLWTEYSTNRMRSGVEFAGDKGTLLIDRAGWTVHPRQGKAQRHAKSELEVEHARNFALAIRGEAEPAATFADGHETAVLCHLGNIATLLGRRIEFSTEAQTITNDAEAAALLSRRYRAGFEAPWA